MNPVRGSGIGGRHHDHQRVGVGDDGALDRVRVVGAAPQQGLAVLDLDQPGQGVGFAADVPDEGDEVAGDHGVAAQFPGAGGDDLAFLRGAFGDDGGVASAVNGDDPPGDGVVVGWAGPWCGAACPSCWGGSGRRIRPRSQCCVPPAVSCRCCGGWRLPCALGEHGLPELREVGHGLGRGRNVLDLDAGHGQAQDGAGRGHAVVGVAVDDTAVQRRGPDDEAVGGLLGVAAEAVDLGDEGGQPVRFVARGGGRCRSAVRGRWPGRRARRRWGRVRWSRRSRAPLISGPPVTVRVPSVQRHGGAHGGEDAAPQVADLGGRGRPVGDPDGAAGGQGRREEGAGVGEVLFDPVVEGADRPGGDNPVVRAGVVHGHARPRAARRPSC